MVMYGPTAVQNRRVVVCSNFHLVLFILSDVTALPLTFGLFVAHGNKGGVVIVSVWVSPHVSKQVEEEKEFLISGHVHWVCQVGVSSGCVKWVSSFGSI